MVSNTFPPLDDHFPAPAGDPNYVPWWAKGEYARHNGTSYTTESGVSIANGVMVGERPEKVAEAAPVPTPSPTPMKRSETPRKSTTTTPQLDTVRLRSMAAGYGLRDDVWKESPNMGVAVMRLKNAARKKGVAV